jgi:Zn-finger nucleic acid-binding protein
MAPSTATALRCLLACPDCERQLDAAGLAAGSRFRCVCGSLIAVPRFRPHDAEVVRCASCGAPRRAGASSCGHCGADYTLHEQDLQTICPSCMTRISDRARFCHHCATPIAPQGEAGSPTKKTCPACGGRHTLVGRRLGEPAVAILECPRCAGLWLGHAGFELARERALVGAPAAPAPAAGRRTQAAARPQGGALYRNCPECRARMNRQNYGRRSGVVVDVCREHGLWFDARELEEILRWIRTGGEAQAAARAAEDASSRERVQRIALDRDLRAAGAEAFAPREPAGLDFVRGLLASLFDR